MVQLESTGEMAFLQMKIEFIKCEFRIQNKNLYPFLKVVSMLPDPQWSFANSN